MWMLITGKAVGLSSHGHVAAGWPCVVPYPQLTGRLGECHLQPAAHNFMGLAWRSKMRGLQACCAAKSPSQASVQAQTVP